VSKLSFDALREANTRRCEAHYHPVDDWSLTDWMCAVSGEAGELAGVIKNIRRAEVERAANGHAIPEATLAKLGDEAADVVIYLDLLCARAGVDLGEAVRAKFNRVSHERLGSGIVL
jgi:NTP pyrophosphatase (non-canonical NTP hydrolase)